MNNRPATLGLSAILASAICFSGCSNLTSSSTITNTAPATVAYMLDSPSTTIVGYSTVSPNTGSSVGTFTLPSSYWAGPVATDSTGQIYVAGFGDPANPQSLGDVFIYPPDSAGAATPSRTIDVDSDQIDALTVDPAGLLYVAINTVSAAPPTVNVYSATASGTATPLRTLQLTDVLQIYDIAADGAGNIYVVTGNAIAVYPPTANGPSTPIRTINIVGPGVYGVAIDAAGNIFASVCLDSNNTDFAIEEFAPGADGTAAPINAISLIPASPWSIVDAGPVRLDGAGNIFTALLLFSTQPGDNNATVVYGFAPTATGNTAPTVQITARFNTYFALN